MRALILMVLLGAVLAPAAAVLPVADACQPLTFVCPLNGKEVHTCGTQVPPPIVYCYT